MKQLQTLAQDYGQTDAAGFAALFSGDVHFRLGQYQDAIAAYAKVLETGPVAIQPIALSNTAASYEAAGKFDQAATHSQSFLDAHADHFLAPHTHSILARSLDLMGKKQEASFDTIRCPMIVDGLAPNRKLFFWEAGLLAQVYRDHIDIAGSFRGEYGSGYFTHNWSAELKFSF